MKNKPITKQKNCNVVDLLPFSKVLKPCQNAQDVKEVTVIGLRREVVIKFISSFWGRGNFCQSRHFVRVCVRAWVCVCLPPAVECSETVCVVPSWTALNFPKRLVSGCKEKVERGEEFLFVEWMGLLIVIFVGRGKKRSLQRLKLFKEKRNCVYGWCLGG